METESLAIKLLVGIFGITLITGYWGYRESSCSPKPNRDHAEAKLLGNIFLVGLLMWICWLLKFDFIFRQLFIQEEFLLLSVWSCSLLVVLAYLHYAFTHSEFNLLQSSTILGAIFVACYYVAVEEWRPSGDLERLINCWLFMSCYVFFRRHLVFLIKRVREKYKK